MKIKLFQIDHEKDNLNIMFFDYEQTVNRTKSDSIDSGIYDMVFSGEVECNDLEGVFRIFNTRFPAGYAGRSMSVSDVVQVCDSENISAGFYFCDSIGFRPILFSPFQEERRDPEAIRSRYPAGTRVVLVSMVGEKQMPAGLKGTVTSVDDAGQIHVRWDNGSSLALIERVDQFRTIK